MADRTGPKMSRKASDFATLADVSQIMAHALEQYHGSPWYRKFWRKIKGIPEPKKVPGLRW